MSTTNEVRTKPRKAWVAVVLSLLAPGVGHIYCGRVARGLVFFLVTLAGVGITFAAASLSEATVSPAAVTVLLVTEAIGLYAVFDAYFVTRRVGPDYTLRWYNRWYVYLALFAIGTSSGMLVFPMGRMKAFYIPNDSMAPTLVRGDRFVADLDAYEKTQPACGDMVVFRSPEPPGRYGIKRVVALAGDTVEIRDGELYVNGRRLRQTPLELTDPAWTAAPKDADLVWENNQGARYRVVAPKGPAGEDFAETAVPSGCVFVLGDNRGHSKDSRHFGPISQLDVRGKVMYLYWPGGGKGRFGPLR